MWRPNDRALGLTGCCLLLAVAAAHAQAPACDFRAPASRDASWSPDGAQLVFDSDRDGNAEIYVMNADGTDPRRLTHTQTSNYYPFFSPDGSRIVFMAFAGEHAAIYVMDADGSRLTRLTDEAGFNADPSWSPDGRQIAFYSERDGNAELYVMNADGTDPRRLTHTESDETTPAWSPDGSRILFISDRDGNAELYVMNADGSHPRRLTHDPLSDRVARWSPDGSRIIFYGRAPTSEAVPSEESWAGAEIYVVPADGGRRTRLTHNDYLDQAPVWSPDGQQIAFTSCAPGNREVYVMDHDGANARRLTFSARPAPDAAGAAVLPLPHEDAALVERYLQTITAEELAGYLHFLASDLFEGRETGTPGQRRAARYLASEYQSLGLRPGGPAAATDPLAPDAYLQPFTVYSRQPARTRLHVTAQGEPVATTTFAPDAHDGHHYFERGNAVGATGDVVFIGYGIADEALGYDDYAALEARGLSIEGKWVMMLPDEPLADDSTSLLPTEAGMPSKWTTNANYKREALLQHGRPLGVLVVGDAGPRAQAAVAEDAARAARAAQGVGALSLYRASPSALPPTFHISKALADQILARSGHTIDALIRAVDGARTPVVFGLDGVTVAAAVEPPEAFETENVLAFIEGTDPALKDEVVVIASHFDHLGIDPTREGDQIYNGAADDGSGTVASFEIAEAFLLAIREGNAPRRSLLFVNFSGEEKGLLGSTYFVEREPAVPLENIAAVLNMDGIGGYDPDNPTGSRDYIYLVGAPLLSQGLRAITARANDATGLHLKLAEAPGWFSDHKSFEYRSIPFLYYSTGLTEHYHQPSDEPSTIDYAHMARVTRLVFATAWQVANQEERPEASLRSRLRIGDGYVCPPCPITPHHDTVYDHPGECPLCRMHLVPNTRLGN